MSNVDDMAAGVRVFIQARISSRRFPAKVLAPFHGRPLIRHVVDRVSRVVSPEAVVVATSNEVSDDPLAAYVKELGVAVFRGLLDDVFTRFQMCLRRFPCEWFFRVCADSPLLDCRLMSQMIEERKPEVNLVTNVQRRTFPRGQSVELVNALTFASVSADALTTDEKEHVTKVFYAHPERYRIVNIDSGDPKLAEQSFAVDTIDDLRRLEELTRAESSL